MAESTSGLTADIWPVLKSFDVAHVAHVPDAGHASTIKAAEADSAVRTVVLTTEEEGIGYLCGAWLGGDRGVLLMQSSGVGNCINTLGLQQNTAFPLLMIVTMRGEWAEFNPWQIPMGHATRDVLEAMGVLTWHVDEASEVKDIVHGAARMAYESERACAVLLGQRLIGAKKW